MNLAQSPRSGAGVVGGERLAEQQDVAGAVSHVHEVRLRHRVGGAGNTVEDVELHARACHRSPGAADVFQHGLGRVHRAFAAVGLDVPPRDAEQLSVLHQPAEAVDAGEPVFREGSQVGRVDRVSASLAPDGDQEAIRREVFERAVVRAAWCHHQPVDLIPCGWVGEILGRHRGVGSRRDDPVLRVPRDFQHADALGVSVDESADPTLHVEFPVAGPRREGFHGPLDDLMDPQRLRGWFLRTFPDGRLDLDLQAGDGTGHLVQRLPQPGPRVEHQAEEPVLILQLAGADVPQDRADLLRGDVRQVKVVRPILRWHRPDNAFSLVDCHSLASLASY